MSGVRLLMTVEQLRRPAPGGIGTYIDGLLRGLDQLDPAERSGLELELVASRWRGGRGTEDPLRSLGHPIRSSRLPGPVLTRAWDRGMIPAPSGFDVVHATSLSTLETSGAALVTTVHDLLWRRVPEAYPRHGRVWHEAALRRALARSDRFIVPAGTVADDLAAAGADRDAIAVIPMGSDHLPPPDLDAAAALLTRLGVTGPFLLSVGTLEPRKNQARLVRAYGLARRSLPEPWPLVLVGPSGWGEQVRPAAGVVLAGVVSPAELAGLYATARLLAYVPFVEGFGLPPVEAMTAGTPVVASRGLPSSAGSAFEVDPHDVDSIADALVVVATDEGERARLCAVGLSRASGLAWSGIARDHLAVWRGAAGAVAGGDRRSGGGRG